MEIIWPVTKYWPLTASNDQCTRQIITDFNSNVSVHFYDKIQAFEGNEESNRDQIHKYRK